MTAEESMGKLDFEALFASWAARSEAGQAPSFGEFLAGHPGQADALKVLHDDWKLFAPLLGRVLPGPVSNDAGLSIAPLSGVAEPGIELPSQELLERLQIEIPNSGRYKFRAVIGRGGGGVVLKVWDSKLHRSLAMKVVLGRGEERPAGDTPHVDGRTLARFVDEARITSQLNHPGIVPVHELGADEFGRAFFTMKLVKGEDLSVIFGHVQSGHDGWNQTRALSVLLKACEAMAFAHEKNVVHRDLKPANVMVGRHGEVYVMDWGLARVLGEKDHRDLRLRQVPRPSASMVDSLRRDERDVTPNSPLMTMDGAVMGTPAYMSPEQARGQIELLGPGTDVYAFGAMLYELLAGEAPFIPSGAYIAPSMVVMRVIEGPPRPLFELSPSTPPELTAICERAMERDVAKRYSDVRALAEDLRAYVERRVVLAYETGTWAETKKWVMRNRALAASIAATLLALVAGLGVALVFKNRADASSAFAQAQTHMVREARNRALESAADATAQQYAASIIGAQVAQNHWEPVKLRQLLDGAPKQHRNWEWRYFDAASDMSLFQLRGHTDLVTSVSYSPNGLLILTSSRDGTARVWDAVTGSVVMRFEGHTAAVNSAEFSGHGKRVITASEDGTACIWKVASGKRLKSLGAGTEALVSASFSPDGGRIFTASRQGELSVYEGDTYEPLARARATNAPIWKASFNAGGTAITTESAFVGPELWAVNDDMELAATGMLLDEEAAAAFSRDGEWMATVRASGAAQVFDIVTGIEVLKAEGYLDLDQSGTGIIEFSPDASQILTVAGAGEPRLRDVAANRETTRLVGHTDDVRSAKYSLDGTRIVTASDDATVRIWDAGGGRQLLRLVGHVGPVLSASFSPDGAYVVSHSEDDTVRVWSAIGDQGTLWHAGQLGSVNAACFSPDATRIVVASDEAAVRVLEAGAGAELIRLEGHTRWVSSAEYGPEGARVVTASRDGTACIWDAFSGKELTPLVGHGDLVRGACFSSDGKRVVTVSRDSTMRIWDATSGNTLLQVEAALGDSFKSARFSANGTRLITLSMGGTLGVYDALSGHKLDTFDNLRPAILSAAVSHQGLLVAAAASDRSVRILDAELGDELLQLVGHVDEVNSVSFNRDDTRIATASSDGTVRVWDAGNGNELVRLEVPGDGVVQVTFSPDGFCLLTISADRSLRLWDSVPNKLRYLERQNAAALLPNALAWVREARDRGADWESLLGELRAEVGFSRTAREVASQELCRCANAVVLEANRLERSWRKRLFLGANVVARLEVDKSLDADLCVEVIRLARVRADDPGELQEWVWEVVWLPGDRPHVYERAARAMRVAAEMAPESTSVWNTLGAALYRAEDWGGALSALQRCRDMDAEERPELVAFLAMARCRMGQMGQAKAELARLRALVNGTSSPKGLRLLAEAEDLFEDTKLVNEMTNEKGTQ